MATRFDLGHQSTNLLGVPARNSNVAGSDSQVSYLKCVLLFLIQFFMYRRRLGCIYADEANDIFVDYLHDRLVTFLNNDIEIKAFSKLSINH